MHGDGVFGCLCVCFICSSNDLSLSLGRRLRTNGVLSRRVCISENWGEIEIERDSSCTGGDALTYYLLAWRSHTVRLHELIESTALMRVGVEDSVFCSSHPTTLPSSPFALSGPLSDPPRASYLSMRTIRSYRQDALRPPSQLACPPNPHPLHSPHPPLLRQPNPSPTSPRILLQILTPRTLRAVCPTTMHTRPAAARIRTSFFATRSLPI